MAGYLSKAATEILNVNLKTLSDDALFQLWSLLIVHRFYLSSNTTNCLRLQDLGRIVDRLLHQDPILYYEPKELIPLERHVRVLAEALLCLSEERFALAHTQAVSWSKLIDTLFGQYQRLALKPEGLEIERWNVAFYIAHCQSLFLRIKNSYSSQFGEETGQVFDASLRGGQSISGKETVFRFQRSPANWHEQHLSFERRSFSVVFSALTEAKVCDSETCLIISLRDTVGEVLGKGKKSTLSKAISRVTGAGPSQEPDEYLTLGLLDMIYQLCFYVSSREECFREIIGTVHTVLDRSSSKPVRREAMEIYFAVALFSDRDRKWYGDSSERYAIDNKVGTSIVSATQQKLSSEYVTASLMV
jgi:hypothetical protein